MSTAQVNELKTIDGTKSVQVADIADGNIGIGVGQTWQDVTASREINVSYINDTGMPIMLAIGFSHDTLDYSGLTILVDNVSVFEQQVISIDFMSSSGGIIIPNGKSYAVTAYGSDPANIHFWSELR